MPSTTMRDQKPGDPESKFSLRLSPNGRVRRAVRAAACSGASALVPGVLDSDGDVRIDGPVTTDGDDSWLRSWL